MAARKLTASFDSSLIRRIAYDVSTSILTVVFRKGGKYLYQGVPVELATRFIAAESAGTFFHEHIKDKFTFIRALPQPAKQAPVGEAPVTTPVAAPVAAAA